jgi:hypothetical protein
VEFYELDLHVNTAGANALREDAAQLRAAREAMYEAQSALESACQHQAHMNYA